MCLFAVNRPERLQWKGPACGVPHERQQGPHRLPLQQTANPREPNWRTCWSPGESFQEVTFGFCNYNKFQTCELFNHDSR